MEQAGHWMWTKRKHSLSSHFPSATSYDDSWEEQAFAEDATGPLGGCIWPPRSYSCSFCKREFKSAQALGGHMNVHRRDRARLKQSSSSPQNEIHHDQYQNNQKHVQNTFASLSFQYPSQVCTSVYNSNPNSDPVVLASPSSPSRVSALPTDQGNRPEKIFPVPLSSPLLQDQHKRSPIYSPQSWSKLVADKYHNIYDLKNEGEENSRFLESACRLKEDYVKTDLSVSLNLIVRRARSTLSDGKEAVGCKRRKTEASSLPLFLKPSSVDDTDNLQSEEREHNLNSIEDLDLELRLGDRPKVK